MKNLSSKPLSALAALSAAGILGVSSADAQQFLNNFGDGIDGDTGAGDNLWSNPANWNAPIPSGIVAWINVSAAHDAFNQDQDKPAGGPATINYAAPSISEFYIGQGGGSGHVLMTAGGSIQAINMNIAHDGGNSGIFDQNGGSTVLTGDLNAGQQATANFAKVNVSGGNLQVNGNLRIGDQNTGGSDMTVTGGIITVNGQTRIGNVNNSSTATGSLTVTGGDVTLKALTAVGTVGEGMGRGSITIGGNANFTFGESNSSIVLRAGENVFTVQGSGATINSLRAAGTALEFNNGNQVNFIADADGFSTVNLIADIRFGGSDVTLNIDGTDLVWDGTSYEVIDLFNFGGVFNTGFSTFGTVNITGFDAGVGELIYNADSIQLAIPEPSTYAAIFGALALFGVMIRRRIRK